MTIKTIDRAGLRVIQERALAKLKELEKELGVTFSIGKGTYGRETGSITIGLALNDATGAAQSLIEADFKRHCAAWDLKPDDLGRDFAANGKTFTLIGAKPSAHRYPLLGKSRNGTTYKFPADVVKRGLAPWAHATLPTARPAAAASPALVTPPSPPQRPAAAPLVDPRTMAARSMAADAMQNRLFG